MTQCVTTTSFSLLINGCPFGCFQTLEGLRQGDSLSPFLFVLVSEVLGRLIDREACSKNIKRFKLAKDLTPITHLQFADDLLLFAQANEENMDRIKYYLNTYSDWSGQKVNFFKSVIIFSRDTPHVMKTRLANKIGINASNKKEKYLGLLMASGRGKKKKKNCI